MNDPAPGTIPTLKPPCVAGRSGIAGRLGIAGRSGIAGGRPIPLLAALALWASAAGWQGAAAQGAKAPDPRFTAAEAAFLALDMATRKSVQDDLIWVAKFPGSPTGDFGPLTYAAIQRFEAEAKLTGDAMLAPPERERLHALAEARRKAAGFVLQVDKVSGMEIGLPAFMMAKTAPNASGGTRWQDKSERVTVDAVVYKPEDTLPVLFEKGIDPKVKGRKITYKLLRPEFFVITGETAGGKFYRRLEAGAGGAIRGFSIGYDKALAGAVDPFIVAIAATFEPFPGAAAKKTAPPLAQGPTQRRATGLVLAPDLIVTSETALKSCADLVITDGEKRTPARIARVLPGTGLMAVTAKTGATLALGLAASTEGAGTLVQRDAEGGMLASPAALSGGKVSVALQEGGAGAALFDKAGGFAGVIAAPPVTKFRVAGVVPGLSYAFVPAAEVFRAAGVTPLATTPGGAAQSAGAIAEAARAGIVSLLCASDK